MSPRTKKQNEAIRQQSEAAIKEAALEMFAKYGFHSTSITQIAKEAGVSNGLMYNYFSGKEELLHTIIQDAIEVNDASWLKFLNADLPAAEKLRQAMDATFELVKSNLHHWKLLTALAFQPDVAQKMEAVIMNKKTFYIQLLTGVFEEMGFEDAQLEVFYFAAMVDGIFLHYMNMEEHYPLDQMKEMIWRRYENK